MIRNNVTEQIEGGLILIKNLQCFIVNERVERQRPFGTLLRERIFKTPEKIQLELQFNGVARRTTQSPVTSFSDNTKKKAAWDEHIHFKVESASHNSNHELIITCWNMNIRGLDGRLGEIRQDLTDFEKFDEFENKVRLTLQEENPKIDIGFYLYYLSNNPPIKEMQQFDELSIRNKQLGMMLFNNITYRNILGHSGSLEFILQQQQACYSTAEYWQTNSIIYNASQSQQPPPKCDYPIAMSLIARPDKLIIRFKHGTKGCAEAKISIGPAGEMESIWPSLTKGGPVHAGEFALTERGYTELKVGFDLSCHSIVTSRHIFKRKNPPTPPRRASTVTRRSNHSQLTNQRHMSHDYYNYGPGVIQRYFENIPTPGSPNGSNPNTLNRRYQPREFYNDTEEYDNFILAQGGQSGSNPNTLNRRYQPREFYNDTEEYDNFILAQGDQSGSNQNTLNRRHQPEIYDEPEELDDLILAQSGSNQNTTLNRKHQSREFYTGEIDDSTPSQSNPSGLNQNTLNRKHQSREFHNIREFDNSTPSQSSPSGSNQNTLNRKRQSREHNEDVSTSHARAGSSASSMASKSSNQKNNTEPYSRQDNNGTSGTSATSYQSNLKDHYIIPPINEEERSPTTSQTSSPNSQKHFVLSNRKRPINTTIMNKNVPTQRNEHHVKIGCSPPLSPYLGVQDYDPIRPSVYDDYNEVIQNQGTEQTPSQDYVPIIQSQPQPQTHFTCPEKYELTSQLQKSKYNEIYIGQNIHNEDKVIIKLYKSQLRWENEVHFLKAIKSKMIVKLEDMSSGNIEEQNYFIITKYFGRSLNEITKDIRDHQLIKHILLNICKAVEWCHSRGVVHMDLNPSNIICKDQKIYRIQLCDFEYSKKIGEYLHSDDPYNQPSSIGYTSPELLSFQIQQNKSSRLSISLHSNYSSSTYYTTPTAPENLSLNYNLQPSYIEGLSVNTSIDIFSLGCIFYFLNTKNLLYTSEKALEKLSLTKICEDIEDDQVSILVKWMVAESSDERPDITRVLENSFFKEKI